MAAKHWIPKKLKKGRCTPMGTAECPPGSPQYNLAKTFKRHHGFHKKQTGGKVDNNEAPVTELMTTKNKSILPKRVLKKKK